MRTEKSNIDKQSEVEDMRDLHFDEPPQTMYKYTSFKSAFNILTNNKIYFAKLSEFNDPFDGLMTPDLSTSEKTEIFMENMNKMAISLGMNWPVKKNREQEFVNNRDLANLFTRTLTDESMKEDINGFCCLTDTYQSLPMWAHYADNHTGCCLVFDFSKYLDMEEGARFPFHHMKKIKYQKDLPIFMPTHDISRIRDYVWHYYANKSHEWEYEHEWRAVMFEKDTSPLHPNSFLSKKSNGAGLYPLGNFLRGVILGHKMENAYKEVIKAAARQRGIFVKQESRELYKYGIYLTEVDNNQSNPI